jgi:OOP family OmpA-OmpF porin
MRKDVVAALVLAASLGVTTQEAAAQGFYVGAGIGEATIEVGPFKDDDLGFKIFGGYEFNKNLAVEVEYIDGGTQKDRGIKLDSSVFAVSVLGQLPLSDIFSLYARLGYGSWDLDVKGGPNDDDEDLQYGLGAAFNVGPNWQVRAEWEALDVSGGDNQFISVSAVYKFAL